MSSDVIAPAALAVVVTGLPASGKSKLGGELARHLQLPLLDKDDYLEELFDREGCSDPDQRQSLSRTADELFIHQAGQIGSAVLVSHWRPRASESTSGTPVEWLSAAFTNLVEVFCVCPAAVAARRFGTRRRHPGHLDDLRGPDELLAWLEAYAAQLPLSLGSLLTVASDQQVDYAAICGDIQDLTQA